MMNSLTEDPPLILSSNERCCLVRLQGSPLLKTTSSGMIVDFSDDASFPLYVSPPKKQIIDHLLQKFSKIVQKAIVDEGPKKQDLLQRRKRISMHVNCMLDNLKDITVTPSKLKLGSERIAIPDIVTPAAIAEIRGKVASMDEYSILCGIISAGLTAEDIIEHLDINLLDDAVIHGENETILCQFSPSDDTLRMIDRCEVHKQGECSMNLVEFNTNESYTNNKQNHVGPFKLFGGDNESTGFNKNGLFDSQSSYDIENYKPLDVNISIDQGKSPSRVRLELEKYKLKYDNNTRKNQSPKPASSISLV